MKIEFRQICPSHSKAWVFVMAYTAFCVGTECRADGSPGSDAKWTSGSSIASCHETGRNPTGGRSQSFRMFPLT